MHGRNKGLWEINFGEERGDDGKWCGDKHNGIDTLWRVWAEVDVSPETNTYGAPERKMWRPITGTQTVAGVPGAQTGTLAAKDNGGMLPNQNSNGTSPDRSANV